MSSNNVSSTTQRLLCRFPLSHCSRWTIWPIFKGSILSRQRPHPCLRDPILLLPSLGTTQIVPLLRDRCLSKLCVRLSKSLFTPTECGRRIGGNPRSLFDRYGDRREVSLRKQGSPISVVFSTSTTLSSWGTVYPDTVTRKGPVFSSTTVKTNQPTY